MQCFLCDSIEGVDFNICSTTLKYRKIPITSILYEFIGNNIEISIENDEKICQICKLLLDELELFRYKLSNIENVIAHKLHRRYQIDDKRTLPPIALDEATANLFVNGEDGHKFRCKMCAFSTEFVDCLVPHNLFHQCRDIDDGLTLEDFPCTNCHLMLPSEDLLKQHLATIHPFVNNDEAQDEPLIISPEKGTFNCPECHKIFTNQGRYEIHIRRGHFICDKCNKNCRTAETLANHKKHQHTQHTCKMCGKQLSSLISYNAHMSTHGVNIKFICSYCNKGFRAKSILETHIVIHSKQTNFTCHICGQSFIHQRAYNLHVKWHQNPRPYKCDKCDKTYTHSSHLAVHRRTHTGERPSVCSHCGRRFISSSKLKIHMATHTGIYPHSCRICSKGYDKRYKLAKHMLNQHGDNTMISNAPKCEYKLVVNPNYEGNN